MNSRGLDVTKVTEGCYVHSASWTPDGRIVYSEYDQEADWPNHDIWLGQKKLTFNPSEDQWPMVDNYGRFFFRSNRGKSFVFGMAEAIEN